MTTQKPVALYRWLLQNYAEPGQTILDTHLGSGSSAIAAYQMGFDFTGCELDDDYFYDAVKRFKQQAKQRSFPIEINLKIREPKPQIDMFDGGNDEL